MEEKQKKGFFGEVARASIVFALASGAVARTPLGKTKLGGVASFFAGAAAAITTNSGSTEEENWRTAGALAVGLVAASGARYGLNKNGHQVLEFLKKASGVEEGVRSTIIESAQKLKEFNRDGSIFTLYGNPNRINQFKEIFDPSKKSLAYDSFTGVRAEEFKKLYFSNNKIVNPDSNYIVRRIKSEKDNSYSFWSNTLKSYSADGKLSADVFFNNKTIFGNIKKLLQTPDDARKYYKNEWAASQAAGESFEVFLDKASKSSTRSLLLDRFKKMTVADGIFGSGKKGEVTLSDVLKDKELGADFLIKASEFFKTDITKIDESFGNIVMKGLKKTKDGKIYDAGSINFKTLGLDVLSNIENFVRPVFAFMPGESTRNFSVIPMKLKGFIENAKYSNFKIFDSGTNFDSIEKSIQQRRNQIINETGEILSFKNNYSGDWAAKKTELLDQLDRVQLHNKYNKTLNNGRNTDLVFPELADEVYEGYSALKFSYNSAGEINGFGIKNYGVAAFIDHEKNLFYKSKAGVWNKKAGKYDISHHGIVKDNQARFMGTYVTKDHATAGMSEDKYYENNILERSKEMGSFLKNKTLRNGDEIFKRELDDYIIQLGKVKDEAVANGDHLLLSKFEEAEKIAVEPFGLSRGSVYNQNWNTPDLEPIESSLKENLVRKLVSNGAITNFDDLSKNKVFNSHYLENTFFKSSFSSQNPTITRIFGSLQKDSGAGVVKKINGEFHVPTAPGSGSVLDDIFIKDGIGTTVGAFASNFVQKFQDALNIVGLNNRSFSQLGDLIEKTANYSKNSTIQKAGKMFNSFLSNSLYIDPNKGTYNALDHFGQLMMKRVLPVLGLVYGAKALEGATDLAIPDQLHEGGIGGVAASGAAAVRVGFQVMLETTGIRGAANWMVQNGFDPFLSALELDVSADELYERHINGKAVAIKKNRFWFGSNRTPFGGSETGEYRQSALYRAQHRTSGIYDNKMERFIREDFVATKFLTRAMPTAFDSVDLLNPYLEEKRALELGMPMTKSEQLFDDVPVFGELLSATVGNLIKPTKYYDGTLFDPNTPLRALEKGFEDIKTMAGFQGYFVTASSNYLFGASKPSDFLRDKFGVDTREHESIDRATSSTANLYDLQLGGLFGTTEPIRRIFTNNYQDVKASFGYEGEQWFKDALNETTSQPKSNTEYLKGSRLMPGPNYIENYGVTSDDSGVYGALDRMTILANNAPHSVAFKQAQAEAEKQIDSAEDQIKFFRALSIANDLKDKNDIVKQRNYIADADLYSTNLKIDSVLGVGEFMSNGKRVKLAGLETDFGVLSNQIGEQNALKQIKGIESLLNSSDSLNVLYNQNRRVKLDSKGEYLEVYAPELDNIFSDGQSDTYLRTMSSKTGFFERAFEFGAQQLRSFSGPAPIMNVIGKRDAFQQWYRESEVMPAFRSWENPYDSFIQPIYNLAEDPVQNAFLLYNLGNMSSSFNGLDRVRDVASTSSLLLAGGVFSKFSKGELPQNYEKDDSIQLAFEKLKQSNGQKSYYDLNETSSYKDLKSSLTYDEAGAYMDLINDGYLPEIQEFGSERFSKIATTMQNKMDNYINGNANNKDNVLEFSNRTTFQNNLTDDFFYNLAVAKENAGYGLTSIEKEKISSYQNGSLFTPSVSVDSLRKRHFGGKINSKVTSTIYTGTQNNKKY